MNLIGEFPVAIDNKGRLRLPTALLRQLGDKPDDGSGLEFVVNKGFEQCLTLWPKQVWDKQTERLSKLNRYNDRNRMFIRSFYAGASQTESDSADRILIQKPLMDYASLSDEAILIAMDDRVEIWSPEVYEKALSFNPNEFSDLANQVMGGGEDGVGQVDDDLQNLLNAR